MVIALTLALLANIVLRPRTLFITMSNALNITNAKITAMTIISVAIVWRMNMKNLFLKIKNILDNILLK